MSYLVNPYMVVADVPADSTYGMWMGGRQGVPVNGYIAEINRVTIGTSGSGEDFGDLSVARGWTMAVADATRGVCGGGGSYKDTIDYVTVAGSVGGTATAWGADLSAPREQAGSCCDETHGLFCGGLKNSPVATLATCDHITIQTTGVVSDWGDLQAPRYTSTGCCTTGVLNNSHGMIFSGYVGNYGSDAPLPSIQYVPIAATGTASDFGDCLAIRLDAGAVANDSRALVAGGSNTGGKEKSCDYFAVGTTGVAGNFGDLINNNVGLKGANNATYGMFAGGQDGTGAYIADIEFVTIASLGDGQSFGDLTVNASGCGGCSA